MASSSRGGGTLTDPELESVLKKLREEPVAGDIKDDHLRPIYARLMRDESDPSLHWFCNKAPAIIRECATFLIRLFAYADNPHVLNYKNTLKRIVTSCEDCVEEFQYAKFKSKTTYLGSFSSATLNGFFDSVNHSEAVMIASTLASNPSRPFPPPVLLHLLSNPKSIFDRSVASVIASNLPSIALRKQPPGLLLLLFHHSEHARSWAKERLKPSEGLPDTISMYNYDIVLESVTNHLSHIHGNSGSTFSPNIGLSDNESFFTSDIPQFWSEIPRFLSYLPVVVLGEGSSENPTGTNIINAVIGHLHDGASHFPDVLKSFLIVLKRAPEPLWRITSSISLSLDFSLSSASPSVVFDAIKDNSAFSRLIESQSSVETNASNWWFLSWFSPFLKSIPKVVSDEPSSNRFDGAFNDVLAKMAAFSFEELQHSRYKFLRPASVQLMCKTMQSLFVQLQSETRAPGDRDRDHRILSVREVIERHDDFIISVAFSPTYATLSDQWNSARQAARDLLLVALTSDVRALSQAVFRLASVVTASKDLSSSDLSELTRYSQLHSGLWPKAYSAVLPSDHEAVRMFLSLVAQLAFFDRLSSEAYRHKTPSTNISIKPCLDAYNGFIETYRAGFLSLATRVSDYSSPISLTQFLQEPKVIRDVVVIMLSPVEALQNSALALIGQAYDVDLRADCIKALLENFPQQTLGAFEYCIKSFNSHTQLLPEACGFAQTLVRALTDVCDALCSQSGGLFFTQTTRLKVLRDGGNATIAQLWKLMTEAISLIFRKTPQWANYYPSAEMVIWMRDALIFARELLSQRRAMQAAVSYPEGQSGEPEQPPHLLLQRKLSRTALRMVDDLQSVLLGALKWLRLTDLELLHQSFKLVEALFEAFRQSEVKPSQESLTKLEGVVDQAKNSDQSVPQEQRTRLTDGQISWLAARLAYFNLAPIVVSGDDEEVQVIDKRQFMAASTTKLSRQSSSSTAVTVVKQEARKGANVVPAAKASSEKPKLDLSSVGLRSKAPGTATATPALSRPLGFAKHTSIKREEPILDHNVGFATVPRVSDKQDASSEDSDSDSDDGKGKGGLAALSKHQKSPERKKARRGIKRLDIPMKGKSAIQSRLDRRDEVQRTAFRLHPDVSSLHRKILAWNFNHSGETPPGFDTNSQTLHSVQETFRSHNDYLKTFEPLLILECWSQLIRAKDEKMVDISCRVVGKSFVDDWVDIDLSVPQLPDSNWFVNEVDIVLLRRPPGESSILAKVQNMKKSKETMIAVRCYQPTPGARDTLAVAIDQIVLLSKVFSLTTTHREYAALKALPYYDLCHDILQANSGKLSRPSALDVEKAIVAHKVNEPQAVAILSALETQGFALVQGPPGTGKTWTICGMVGAFMSKRGMPATIINAGRAPEKVPKKKILLCAPSNAAIDELAKRVKDGVLNSAGQRVVPNIVRVGADSSINISTKDISLDYLVDQKLDVSNKATDDSDMAKKMASLRNQIDLTKKERENQQEELSAIRDNVARVTELEKSISSLNAERQRLSQRLNKLKDEQKSSSRNLDASRRRVRLEILLEADVICSTLSGSGHEFLEQFDFEMVIIDEAAQAIELSSLIPLKYRCTRCILVGDPKQLPPTVLSPLAAEYGYNRSLFTRIESQRPNSVHLLSIQYRMHPDISKLPSVLFYNGRLTDGPGMETLTKQPWHASPKFQPYRFFNIAVGHEESPRSGHSLINRAECEAAVALYNLLKKEFATIDFDFRIGIVSMYRAQVQEMKIQFQRRFGRDIVGKIDFNTVDGFQGQEKDIIILSCVRGGPGVTKLGFVRDERRMNVSITRSRSSLFILGHAATLERSDAFWEKIVVDARNRGCMVDANAHYFEKADLAPTSSPEVAMKPLSKKTMREPPVVPKDLHTPRALAARNRHQDRSVKQVSLTGAVSPSTSTAQIVDSDPHSRNESKEAKGPLARLPKREHEAEGSSSKPPQERSASHHKLPIKPKKEVSIFIPKKRPLPPDNAANTAGHTNAKRRILDEGRRPSMPN